MSTSNTTPGPRNAIDGQSNPLNNYKLLVMAGSSYDEKNHQIVTVNDSESLLVDGPHMAINLHVRVRDYDGLPLHSPRHSCYFDHEIHQKDLYSIAFSFIPKKNINTNSLVWGNDFDHPIRDQLPPGFNIAYKIAKTFIDPGIDCDAYSDRPWSYGPALSCWFSFRIGEQQQNGDQINEEKCGNFQHKSLTIGDQHVIEEGADGDGQVIRERYGIPENAKKRRKHFLSISNRKAFNFEAGRVYHADFFNPYYDPNKVLLRLPGIKIES